MGTAITAPRHRQSEQQLRGGPIPRSPQVLQSLATRQPGQPWPKQFNLATYPLRIRPRVLPQRPPDRLAQPERGVVDVRLDGVREQVEVGVGAVLELAEDRSAAQPRVVADSPLAHRRSGLP